MKKSCVCGLEYNMPAIIILFCVLGLAASLTINSQNADVDILLGNNVELKWQFTTTAADSFISANIKLSSATLTDVNVAVSTTKSVLVTYEPYKGRSWTATRPQNKKEIILHVKNAKSVDDGVYTLELQYLTSGSPKSHKHGIRLNVLVKPHYPTGSYDSGTKTSDEGKQVTIKCEPDGSPKPIEIIWEKDNRVYKRTDTNDSNLSFDNVRRADTGTYVCKARNKAGDAAIEPSTQLIVKYKPVNTEFVAKSPLLVGTNVNLECTADADPEARYSISGEIFPGPNSEKTGIFPFTVDLSKDGSNVTCTPFNRLGNGQAKSLILDVQVKPKIVSFPSEWNAIEGKNISATCDATGKPAPEIIWLKDGVPLRNMPKDFVGGKLDKVFVTTSTLTLSPARRRDNAKYGCQAKNKHGDVTKSVTLKIKYLPEVTQESINEFKNLDEVHAGHNVKLACRAEGEPKTGYYVWRWENGTVIQNETSGVLEFRNIQPYQGGRLSCAGGSYIGEGDKAYVNVDVRVPPRIIVPPQQAISLNESKRLQLFCNATGVPEPTIHWFKDGETLDYEGERLSIYPVKYTDKGTYRCTADNGIPPNVSASTVVTIYFRPVIQTTSAAATLRGAESGQTVTLVCVAEALPLAQFKWLSYPSMQELNTTLDDILDIKQQDEKTLTMDVKARYGAKYVCYVNNNRGNDTQIYEIRPKGEPEAPRLDSVRTYIHNVRNKLSTVRARLKWTPGYNGGERVTYIVHYGSTSDQTQFAKTVDDDCNCVEITQNLEANKDYGFSVQASNTHGPSNSSNQIRQRTKAFFGSASVQRLDDGKIVKVSFVIYTKRNVTKEVRFHENKENSVEEIRTVVAGVQEPLVIHDLDPDKHYLFQVWWKTENEQELPQITDGGEVLPWNPPVNDERSSSTLSKEEIIAVIAGVGGFLLIVILVLFLCLIRRRQKPKRDETVVVMRRQPQSVDVVTRRSLIGSVEDDPFESAHYGTQDKKKARDSYYLPDSEDMNTFTADDNTAKRGNPTESSRAYQPYIIGQKSRYNEDERSSSDDDSYGYNRNKKPPPSDDEISEPGYARVGENGKVARDKTDGSRDPSRPNPNSVYAKVDKGNNNNRAMSNGRGAPPPYRPRSTTDTPLPPYPDDHLDLDDPSAAPFDDPLPPPMPVLSNSRPVPDAGWNDRYHDDPFDSVDTTMERQKSPSRTSLGSGKPYINAQGKLVRPGSRHSSSDYLSDSEQRLPEPEVPTGRSRQTTEDQSNLVSYLV